MLKNLNLLMSVKHKLYFSIQISLTLQTCGVWFGTLVNTGVIISPCYAILKLKSQSPCLTFKTMKSPLTAFRKPHTMRRHFEYYIYFASIFCTRTPIIYELPGSCPAPISRARLTRPQESCFKPCGYYGKDSYIGNRILF